MNLHFSIFGHNRVHLGFEILPKIAAWFSPILQPFLVGFLRIASLYFILFFWFFLFFRKKTNFRESPKIGWWQLFFQLSFVSLLQLLWGRFAVRLKSWAFLVFYSVYILSHTHTKELSSSSTALFIFPWYSNETSHSMKKKTRTVS